VTPEQTAAVLGKAAAYDQRTIGAADVLAWHEVVGYLEFDDCLEAVTAHYREQSDRAMPADVRKLALNIRDARQARERQHERRLALEAGPPARSDEVKALVQAVADALPKVDNHTRALNRARQERGRPGPPPKTKKPKTKPKDYPPPHSDEVAAMATRYLIDGHAPAVVAERLAVSRRWCERTVKRLQPAGGAE
jgi:hypothetical protein